MYFFFIISHDLSFIGKAGRFSIIKVWQACNYWKILANKKHPQCWEHSGCGAKIYHTRYNIPSAFIILSRHDGK